MRSQGELEKRWVEMRAWWYGLDESLQSEFERCSDPGRRDCPTGRPAWRQRRICRWLYRLLHGALCVELYAYIPFTAIRPSNVSPQSPPTGPSSNIKLRPAVRSTGLAFVPTGRRLDRVKAASALGCGQCTRLLRCLARASDRHRGFSGLADVVVRPPVVFSGSIRD